MKINIRLENAEELLQLLNRATTLSNELEETLQCINSLKCVRETYKDEFVDTSVGSVTDTMMKSITEKLQPVTETLLCCTENKNTKKMSVEEVLSKHLNLLAERFQNANDEELPQLTLAMTELSKLLPNNKTSHFEDVFLKACELLKEEFSAKF